MSRHQDKSLPDASRIARIARERSLQGGKHNETLRKDSLTIKKINEKKGLLEKEDKKDQKDREDRKGQQDRKDKKEDQQCRKDRNDQQDKIVKGGHVGNPDKTET